MQTIITLQSEILRYTGTAISNPHQISIPAGITAVVGPNGSGKSTLAKILESGWNFMTNRISAADGSKRLKVVRVEFSDIYTLAGGKGEYYQQRYESTFNDDVPSVAEMIGERGNTPEWRAISSLLGTAHLMERKLNFLSSGELRKILIANIMIETPDLLILDNPYIGLDTASRAVLNDALRRMQKEGKSVLLLIANPAEIPDFATAALPMQAMTAGKPIAKQEKESGDEFRRRFEYLFQTTDEQPASQIEYKAEYPSDTEEIVRLTHCKVKYGKQTLLNDISWTIKKGECWSLSGANGSGKSTLLSLINADNPQVYSNDIRLFGHKRGSGESIWEVKCRIGYISPERHLYFNAYNASTLEVVAGGKKESINQFRALTTEEKQSGMHWLKVLKIEHLADRKFAQLSFGEQRTALLGRVLIKNAPLLILDEPLHGLDATNKRRVNQIINQIAKESGCTLIYVTHYEEEIPECIGHTKRLQPHSSHD